MSIEIGTGAIDSLDPEQVRLERDRKLAIEFVRRGEARSAIREIAAETKINLRTVYRSVCRQLDWAREYVGAQEASGEAA
jgi:hypothetical protein